MNEFFIDQDILSAYLSKSITHDEKFSTFNQKWLQHKCKSQKFDSFNFLYFLFLRQVLFMLILLIQEKVIYFQISLVKKFEAK